MSHPHDDLLFARFQGFYEFLVEGPDCGRTHATNQAWNEAYDEGRNEAEALDGPEGRKPFSVPEISAWMDEATYLRVSEMIDTAARLCGDGEGGELGDNAEFERGMIEMICAQGRLPAECRGEVREAIHAVACELNAPNAA